MACMSVGEEKKGRVEEVMMDYVGGEYVRLERMCLLT